MISEAGCVVISDFEIWRRVITPLGPQSRFGDEALEFHVVCPQNGTAVLKGLT